VQLKYPAANLLDDSEAIDFPDGELVFRGALLEGRSANRFGNKAHVTFELDMLRAKQQVILWELLRFTLTTERAADSAESQSLERLWASVRNFRAVAEVDIAVWSANSDPAALRGTVALCDISREAELTACAKALIAASWQGYVPVKGIRRWLAVGRRALSVELAELIALDGDAVDHTPGMPPTVDATVAEHGQHAVLRFTRPPWDLSGHPFPASGVRRRDSVKAAPARLA
jgi:hypothetical protein